MMRDSKEELNMIRRIQSDGNLTYFDEIRRSASASIETEPYSAVQRVNGSFRLAHLLSMVDTIDLAGFLAVQHFNARSGEVLPHLPELLKDCDLYFTVEMLSNVSDPKFAVTKLLERLPKNPTLANPRPIGIVGSSNSRSSKALAIIGGVNNLVQSSPSATSPDLDEREMHPYFTRPIPTNLGSARAAVAYYKFLNVSHVAALFVRDVYGREFSKVFIEEAEKENIDVFSVSFDEEDHLEKAVKQLKASRRKYIFGMFYDSTLEKIAEIAAPAGIMGQDGYVWILGEASGNMPMTAQDRESRLKDINGIGWMALKLSENERYNAALESFKADESLQEYYVSKTDYRTNFTAVEATDFQILNYDCVMAIGIAACEAENDFFSAFDLYESMMRMKFEGATENVEFNNKTGTRLLRTVQYVVFNGLSHPNPEDDKGILFRSVESAVVSLDPSGSVVEIISPFVYADNTTNPPRSLPPQHVNVNLIPKWALVLGLLLCGIMMFMSICWAAWSIHNRKKRVVKASQPFFLIMLCIGTFFIASSIIPTSFQEPMSERTLNVGCMLFPWLACTGFVTAFSALFTKNGRINALYQKAKAFRRVSIKPKDVILPFLILLALNLTLLALWTALAPWKWKRVEAGGVDRFGRATATYGTCMSDNETIAKVFGSLLGVINIIPIIMANFQSYRCRNLPSEFNESQYLSMSMASILETFLIALPFIFITVKPTAVFITRVVFICLICLAILVPMFVPKWRRSRHQTEPKARKVPIISDTSALSSQ